MKRVTDPVERAIKRQTGELVISRGLEKNVG